VTYKIVTCKYDMEAGLNLAAAILSITKGVHVVKAAKYQLTQTQTYKYRNVK